MPRSRPPYPPQFRVEAVKLAQTSQKSLKQIEDDLGVSTQSLRNWVRQAEVDERLRDGLPTSEREELRLLRSQNRALREECRILRKVSALFPSDNSATR